MTLTMNEAIQLILDFCPIFSGFWKEIPIKDPLVLRFIDAGYAALDEERQEKYKLNDRGTEFLRPYIKQISTTFIEFLKKNRLSCYHTDGIDWFSDTYNLDNETAEGLYYYITWYIKIYGYERQKFHQSGCGWGYDFEKVDV